MRGYPIWQVIFVVLMFAAAGVPILRLTAPGLLPAVVAAPVPTGADAAETTLEVSASFAPAPADFAVRYLGNAVVLSGQGPTADFTGQWKINVPPEGVDLTLQAHWPAGTPGHVAAHVAVRFPDGRATEKTFWGDAGQPMVEVVTVTP